MSIVQTTTATRQAAPLILKLKLSSKQEAEMAVNQLSAILDRFRAESPTDPLSHRLFRWGHDVLMTAAINGLDEESAVLRIVREKIDKLAGEILLSQVGAFRLTDPVLDGDDITWEGAIYADYQSMQSSAHIETAPSPSPHLFATEILRWMHDTCLASEAASASGMEVVAAAPCKPSSETEQLYKMQRFFIYELLVSKARAIVHEQKLQQQIVEQREYMASLTERMQEMARRALDRAEQRCAEHILRIETRIHEIEEFHTAHNTALQQQLAEERAMRGDAVLTLEGLIENEKKVNQETVDILNGQASALREALHDTATKLTLQSTEMEGKVKELSNAQRAEIEAVELQHLTTIADIEQKNLFMVNGLQTQLSKIQTESDRLNTELTAVQNISASLMATIASLRQQNAQQAQQIAIQQDQINEAGNDFLCAVM